MMSQFLPPPSEFPASLASSEPNPPVPPSNESAPLGHFDTEQGGDLDSTQHVSHTPSSLPSIKGSYEMNGLDSHNSTDSIPGSTLNSVEGASICCDDGGGDRDSSHHSKPASLPRKRSRKDVAEEDRSIDESMEKANLRGFAGELAAQLDFDEEDTMDLLSFAEFPLAVMLIQIYGTMVLNRRARLEAEEGR
ncbi:hypothetical protein CPB86DRAFT_826324 [Serendipita vermifera]|nr:hypothetical protein CPB86DRAFT_826324 [Serendipita vermifera]